MAGDLGGAPGGNHSTQQQARRERRIREIVKRVYQRTRLRHCCDPRDLAEAMGLRVRPESIATAYIAEGILRFPNRALLPQRGQSIYEALARYLLVIEGEESSREAIRFAAAELALPELTARTCRLADLAKVQPHFPLSELENVLMSLHGSCVMVKNPMGI
jgi:hypothetical protein